MTYMFDANSRYAKIPIVEVETATGKKANAVKLRRLPYTPGNLTEAKGTDRLDIMAHRRFEHGARGERSGCKRTIGEPVGDRGNEVHFGTRELDDDQGVQSLLRHDAGYAGTTRRDRGDRGRAGDRPCVGSQDQDPDP